MNPAAAKPRTAVSTVVAHSATPLWIPISGHTSALIGSVEEEGREREPREGVAMCAGRREDWLLVRRRAEPCGKPSERGVVARRGWHMDRGMLKIDGALDG
jgi:hypothetical protein